jgi:hypothetical protein
MSRKRSDEARYTHALVLTHHSVVRRLQKVIDLSTAYNLFSCSPILHHTRRYRDGATLGFTGLAELIITREIYCECAQIQ